ncbi:hypothetical protein [Persicobacter psychrovividus]|uniref:Uncharacterized protein n=1 Tax=Persicobacter psychrovividus TaxID=387638 RepID=A0ABM7VMB3_9BACT|nr:hypothetical protein PEPS_44010 [Persicobacter psychrovividus]
MRLFFVPALLLCLFSSFTVKDSVGHGRPTASEVRSANAGLSAGVKVFLTFEDISGEVNVNGDNAVEMLADYLYDRTNCTIVDDANAADYILKLNVIEKKMTYRRARLVVLTTEEKEIFNSDWKVGSSDFYNGFSGSRQAIKRTLTKGLFKQYKNILK